MDKAETAALLSAISDVHPKHFKGDAAQICNTWHRFLGDLDFESARKALDTWLCESRYAPTVADIRELVGAAKPDKRFVKTGTDELGMQTGYWEEI